MIAEHETRELARQHGFISGARAGYRDPGLWVKDFVGGGGGYTSIYPSRGRWIVTFTGPGSNIPYASESFQTAEQAFHYATS